MAWLTIRIPSAYFNASHDILRMLCIQLVVQFLFNVAHPRENPFFSTVFFQTISFVLIGVAFYWLVVHYLIEFKSDGTYHSSMNKYTPATHTPQKDRQGIQMDTPNTIPESSIHTDISKESFTQCSQKHEKDDNDEGRVS